MLEKDAFERLNSEIDCDDLAQRLGMEKKAGMYKNPNTPDNSATLKCYPPGARGGSRWKDHRLNTSGGPIDLLMLVRGMELIDAAKELASMYGMNIIKPRDPTAPRREQSLPEFIAANCLRDARGERGQELVDYLTGRGLMPSVIERAVKGGTLGFNTFTSNKVPAGEPNYGGPAVAFIVKDRVSSQVVAVDMRYFDPALNGKVKTQSQGLKDGVVWCADWRKLAAARTVYIVESSINALCIEQCNLPSTAALALRGTSNASMTDWSFLRGKQVIACLDNDEPMQQGTDAGYCLGLKAAWALHEALTAIDVSCVLIDQSDWFEDLEERKKPINDVNDYMKIYGTDGLATALKKTEAWMIAGMIGDDKKLGKPRLYLPAHDYMMYWKYRTQLDFTKVIGKTTKDDDGNEKHDYHDVTGFRVAAISRVSIASYSSTMTGDVDHSGRSVFALSVQVARHGAVLQRRVVDDEKLHNIDVWKKLGPVYSPVSFARMVNIWERAAHIGARQAINFVGLAWNNGKPVVNEGADCFFSNPKQQCPYHSLVFPSNTKEAGRKVVELFSESFKDKSVLIPLVWALGAHLKAFLGFWPHYVMQAGKGTGKSSVVKSIERAIAMKTSSRQSLQTEFRQLTSLSYTSHPIGWGEISTNKQDVINRTIHNLQEAYMYEHSERGAELLEFLISAPVLLSGEDVPVDSLVGKIVRSQMTLAQRGTEIPHDCPVFPVKQWLHFLASHKKDQIRGMHQECVDDMAQNAVSTENDPGAKRMVINYSAVVLAWRLLCEFLETEPSAYNLIGHLTEEMNRHITETASERQPWAWLVEKLLSEIAANRFAYPFIFDTVAMQDDDSKEPVLCVRTSHVIDHMRHANHLREFWDGVPIKSDRVFKKQMEEAGVLLMKGGKADPIERTVKGQRISHMVALSVKELKKFGLYASMPMKGWAGQDEDDYARH